MAVSTGFIEFGFSLVERKANPSAKLLFSFGMGKCGRQLGVALRAEMILIRDERSAAEKSEKAPRWTAANGDVDV